MKPEHNQIAKLSALMIMAAVALLAIIAFRELRTMPECTPELCTVAALAVSEPEATEKTLKQDETADDEILLSFIGNISPASALGSNARGTLNSYLTETDDFVNKLRDITETDAMTVASCNAVLAEDGTLSEAEIKEDGTWLLGDKANAKIYGALGIDAVSTETTHILDYDEAGRSATVASLNEAELTVFAEGNPLIFTANGISVCVLTTKISCSNPSIAWLVRIASTIYDAVIVYAEADDDASQPSEWRMMGAREMINAGAKAVIEYTNTVQQVVRYGGGCIAYSLGNFIDGSVPSREQSISLVLSLKVKRSGTTGKISVTFSSITCVSAEDEWLPAPLDSPDETSEETSTETNERN